MTDPTPINHRPSYDTIPPRPPDTASPNLEVVLDGLLDHLRWVVLTLGILALGATLNRWLQTGWHIQHAIHLSVYLLIIIGVMGRGIIPRRDRVALILGALGVNGAANLFWYGLAGTGLLFLAIVCILTIVFANVRVAWSVLGVSSAFIALIGLGVWSGVLPIIAASDERLRSGTEWLAQGMAFLALVIGAIIAVNAIQQALRHSFDILNQHTTALEREMRERKRMEAQLLQAEKLQAIGRLAGGIAHDFNNQLAGVIGYAEMLKRQKTDDPLVCRFADNILLPAHRAADLTGKLLAFARKGHYREVPVNLHDIIYEVIAILDRSIDKTIIVKQFLLAESHTILGDPTLLQSAVLNIALNARDAMPEGGELSFSTENLEETKDSALSDQGAGVDAAPRFLLRICDTGVGMDKETQCRIFEPFFTTKSSGEGTGMGLAAVHGTVHSHGGKVDVTSTPGKGTCFTLSFTGLVDSVSPKSSSEVPGPKRGEGHVLVVDDEPSVLEMTKTMLQTLGYRVTKHEKPDTALSYFASSWRDIDLVLLDMVLPEMSGKELFDAMRKENPDARILLFSGYSSEKEAQQLLSHGATGFLQKPFVLVDLSAAVAELMEKDYSSGHMN